MVQIKATRSWQQLQGLVEAYGAVMNHMHVSAVVTHMAQLHTSGSGRVDNGAGAGRTTRSSVGASDAGGARAGVEQGVPGSTSHSLPVLRRSALAAVQQVPSPRAPGKPPEMGAGAQGAGTQLRNLRLAPLPQPLSASGAPAQLALSPLAQGRVAFLVRMQDAVSAHLPNFRARQLANTLWAFAKLGHRPPAAWLAALLARMRAQLPAFETQHLANTMYALMLVGYMPPSPWLSDFFAAVNSKLHQFTPGELAHLCYATGKMRVTPGLTLLGGFFQHSQMGLRGYGLRELAMLLHGLVHMGGELHPDWMRMYRVRVARILVESGAVPRPLLRKWGRQLSPSVLGDLVREQLRKQQLQQGDGRGRGAGEAQPPITGELVPRGARHRHGQDAAQPCAAPDDVASATALATILSSMASWLYQPPQAFMEVLLGTLHASVPRLEAEQLTGLLLSLAHMDYRPQHELFQDVWQRIMQSADTLGRQHRTNALWAAGRLRCAVPRSDVLRFLKRTACELYDHTDAEVVAVLSAAVRLRFRPERDWLLLVESHLFERLPHMKPFELVEALQHLTSLGHRPERVWMARWAVAAQAGLAALGLSHLSVAAHSAARLGFRPPAGLRAELLRATGERIAAVAAAEAEEADVDEPQDGPAKASTPGRQHEEVVLGRHTPTRRTRRRKADQGTATKRARVLGRLLWSLAVLDIRPGSAWMAAYMACLQTSLEHCGTRELSLVVWALARLRHDPGPEWMAVFRSRAGRPGAREGPSGQEPGHGSGAADAAEALRGSVRGQQVDVSVAGASGSSLAPAVAGAGGAVTVAAASSAAGPTGSHSGAGDCAPVLEHGNDAARGLDFSCIILQGITAWAERQFEDTGKAAVAIRRAAKRVHRNPSYAS